MSISCRLSRSRQQRVRYDDSLSIDAAVNNNDRKTKRLLDNSVALLQLFEDEPEKIRQPLSDELLAQTEVANCMVVKMTQQREDVTCGSKGLTILAL